MVAIVFLPTRWFFLYYNCYVLGKISISQNLFTLLTYFSRETTVLFLKLPISYRISETNSISIKHEPSALAGPVYILSRHTKISVNHFFYVGVLSQVVRSSSPPLCLNFLGHMQSFLSRR